MTFTLIGFPGIAVDTSLNFANTFVGDTLYVDLVIRNAGNAQLDVTSITSDNNTVFFPVETNLYGPPQVERHLRDHDLVVEGIALASEASAVGASDDPDARGGKLQHLGQRAMQVVRRLGGAVDSDFAFVLGDGDRRVLFHGESVDAAVKTTDNRIVVLPCRTVVGGMTIPELLSIVLSN